MSAARLAGLATGRAGLPTAEEWPWVVGALVLVAVLGMRLLLAVGLTRVEAGALAIAAPPLVLVDAPLAQVSPGMALAANLAGCVIPCLVALSVLVQRRGILLEVVVLLGLGIGVAFFASHVVPGRGVMLQYRLPALVLGVTAAALFHAQPERAGATAFAAGALGVLVGADLLHLRELVAASGGGRVILGGAGLIDGILLVGLLAAAVAASVATVVRAVTTTKPAAPAS